MTASGPRRRSDDVDLAIGNRIRQRRREIGWTQVQLAEALGITYQQANKYELGRNRMSASRLWHAAQALNLTMDELFAELDTQLQPQPFNRERYELLQAYAALPDRHRDLIRMLARVLGPDTPENGDVA